MKITFIWQASFIVMMQAAYKSPKSLGRFRLQTRWLTLTTLELAIVTDPSDSPELCKTAGPTHVFCLFHTGQQSGPFFNGKAMFCKLNHLTLYVPNVPSPRKGNSCPESPTCWPLRLTSSRISSAEFCFVLLLIFSSTCSASASLWFSHLCVRPLFGYFHVVDMNSHGVPWNSTEWPSPERRQPVGTQMQRSGQIPKQNTTQMYVPNKNEHKPVKQNKEKPKWEMLPLNGPKVSKHDHIFSDIWQWRVTRIPFPLLEQWQPQPSVSVEDTECRPASIWTPSETPLCNNYDFSSE